MKENMYTSDGTPVEATTWFFVWSDPYKFLDLCPLVSSSIKAKAVIMVPILQSYWEKRISWWVQSLSEDV